MNNFKNKLNSFFEIEERGSTIKSEIIGGITTFFAMCYIMIVNPNQMTGFEVNATNGVWQAIFIATAIGAIIGTLLMALYAKLPFAQAPGMGLNSFFFVSFMVTGFGSAASIFAPDGDITASYYAGMSIIFMSGILFMVLTLTGLRKKIAEAMPDGLKKAIPAGIGLFIAYIAFQNAGIIESNQFVQVQFVDLTQGWYGIVPPITALLGLLIIGVLSRTKLSKASVIIGILASAALYYLFNIGHPSAGTGVAGVLVDGEFLTGAAYADPFAPFVNGLINPGDTFKSFGQFGIGAAFKGFKYWTGGAVLSGILLVITFCLVDMFDTLGTLQGTAAEADMLDEEGNPKNLGKALICDSAATLVGGVVGTSTVTTFVESAAGVSAGARTGLSSLVVAFLFFIAMFLSPLAQIIPSAAVAPALIYVGVLMLKNIKDVDFSDMTNSIPAFLAVIMMPLTYSISNGIGIGMIAYVILKLATTMISGKEAIVTYFKGDFIKKEWIVVIIAILFALRFFLVKM